MVDINVNNLQINDDGRISFSGLGSGIDFEAAVDGIIAAKRVPIDRLEAKIETNQAKIDDLIVARSLTSSLRESLNNLHGAVTFDQTGSIFAAKQAFATTTRDDGAAPSPATNLMGVSVTSSAAPGNHTVEVLQTARAHRVGSAGFLSTAEDLGTARGLPANSISGSIEINGKSIAVLPNDNLVDLADRLNSANSGDDPTGVSASIVSTGDTSSYLVLTVDETGQTLGTDISLGDPDNVLEKLGVLTVGDEFASELQPARMARFHADGLLDNRNYSSQPQVSGAVPLGSVGTLTFSDSSGAAIGTFAYLATDSLDDIANAISNDPNLSNAGITAAVVTDDDGATLKINGTEAFNISDSSMLLTKVGVAKDELVIERTSNTISDLFDGVTLTLFQAEAGTTINVDIERDLSAVKTGVVGFVEAYNNLRFELNRQLNIDPITGEANEDATLFGNPALEEIDRRLERIVGSGADGVSSAFSVLAQIGIDFVKNGEIEDPLLRDTLTINDGQLDEALLNSPTDVQKLFEFSFSASDPRVVLLGFNAATAYKEGGYTLDIDYDEAGGEISALTLDEGAASATGNSIDIDSGGAKGLRLFYSGDSDLSGVSLNYTVGVGAKLFFDLDSIVEETSGLLAAEIDSLTEQNEVAEERSEAMLERLDRERESQLNKFIRMETALQTMNQLLEQLQQMTDAMFQDR